MDYQIAGLRDVCAPCPLHHQLAIWNWALCFGIEYCVLLAVNQWS